MAEGLNLGQAEVHQARPVRHHHLTLRELSAANNMVERHLGSRKDLP
jgi:hypothetical protein